MAVIVAVATVIAAAAAAGDGEAMREGELYCMKQPVG
jgi:hypothetical protein